MNTRTYATEFDDANDSFLNTQNERDELSVVLYCNGDERANLILFGRHFEYSVGWR